MAEFDDDITERIRKQKEFAAATAAGKTLKQWREDRQYLQDIADIEAENKASEAEEAAEEGKWTPGVDGKLPESEAARNARLEGERQAEALRSGESTGKIEAMQKQRNLELQNKYLPGAGQSPKYMGEAPPEERKPTGIPAQMDPFVREEMERQAL